MWTQKNLIIIENSVFAAIFNCFVITFRIFLHPVFRIRISFHADPDPKNVHMDPDPKR